MVRPLTRLSDCGRTTDKTVSPKCNRTYLVRVRRSRVKRVNEAGMSRPRQHNIKNPFSRFAHRVVQLLSKRLNLRPRSGRFFCKPSFPRGSRFSFLFEVQLRRVCSLSEQSVFALVGCGLIGLPSKVFYVWKAQNTEQKMSPRRERRAIERRGSGGGK